MLDSRNSIQLNKSWNSSVDFQFEDPINKEDGCILMSGSILNFSASNSIYNINETNNYLFFNTTRQNYQIYIPYGNYNFNTLQNTLYSIGIGSILLSLNVNTNIITFTNTVDSYFFIDSTSTILPIIGGIIGTSYYNQQTILTLPYQCNFNGVNNINIYVKFKY